jgi:hypothetical protein
MPDRQLYLARACRWRQMAEAAANDTIRDALLQLVESYERLAASMNEVSQEHPVEPTKGNAGSSNSQAILEREPWLGVD